MLNIRTLVLSLSLAPVAALAALSVDQMKAEFAANSQELERSLGIIKVNAPSCGVIGWKMAGYMDEAIVGQQAQRKKILDVITSAQKSGTNAKPVLDNAIAEMEKYNEQSTSNLSRIRYGLSTNSPTCKQASAAFERLYSISMAMPGKFRAIIAALAKPSASRFHDAAYDLEYSDYLESDSNE